MNPFDNGDIPFASLGAFNSSRATDGPMLTRLQGSLARKTQRFYRLAYSAQ